MVVESIYRPLNELYNSQPSNFRFRTQLLFKETPQDVRAILPYFRQCL